MAKYKLEKPELVVGPHETIQELMQEYNMNVNELALRLNRSQPKTSELVNGKVLISPETAKKLERVFGVSTEFWLNYTESYREYLKEYRDYEEKLKITVEEQKVVNVRLYKDLEEKGYVSNVRLIYDKVLSLRSFFRVADLRRLEEIYTNKFAFSMKKEARSDLSISTLAWIRIVEVKSREMQLPIFSKKKVKSAIPKIRELTRFENLKEFLPKLTKILAECGVSLILEPETYNAKIFGLTYWLSKSKPVIALSFRRKTLDSFWFALFHEIGHLLMHQNKNIIELGDEKNDYESEANVFATEALIPSKELEKVKNNAIDEQLIKSFAETIGTHPSIVVVRLKHEKLVAYNRFCELHPRFEIGEFLS